MNLMLLALLVIAASGSDRFVTAAPVESTPIQRSTRSVEQERPDWGKYFQQAGVKGGFVLYNPQQNQYLVYDAQRVNTRLIPVSTFKIFNSLVALETGVIRDENQVIKWDGVEREFPDWNRDYTMRTAIENSTIWFYQELARRIGQERMQHYINLANYGNRDISGGIDQFWLRGGLRISAKEQIDLLVKLYRNQLPFSTQTMATVKDILINEQTDDYILRGKTGWGFDLTPRIGWYVGYLEQGDNVYFFALNLDDVKPENTKARQEITKQILRDLGLL